MSARRADAYELPDTPQTRIGAVRNVVMVKRVSGAENIRFYVYIGSEGFSTLTMARTDRWSNGRLIVGLLATPLKKIYIFSGYTLSMFSNKDGFLEDLVRRIIDFGHEPTVVRGSTIE